MSNELESLLTASDLPISELCDHPVALFGYYTSECVVGTVGVEIHGTASQFPSLVLAAMGRGNGLRAALFAHGGKFATNDGAEAKYFPTSSAAEDFSDLGYELAPKDAAPPSGAATLQSSVLWPSSSVLIAKKIRDPST